ncbi:MAG: DUF2304 domain-containing protein [Clostridia bacterium]|nr:DUF2304 domain-containing protein [Clostridia bacterium]
MDLKLQIFFIAFALVFLTVVLRYLVIKKFNLKYALVWLLTATVLLVLAIFPKLAIWAAGLIGIQLPVNAIFLFAILFAFIIILTLTAIVSHMNKRVYRITQMQAILEKRVRELEEKIAESGKNDSD